MDAKRQSQVLIGVALLIISLLIGYRAIDQDYQSRQVYETTIHQQIVIIVFVTDTGTKYHRDGCQYLNMSKHQMNLKQAINQGYTPCSVCNPPNG